jgi:hypothetical protein
LNIVYHLYISCAGSYLVGYYLVFYETFSLSRVTCKQYYI